MSILTGPAFACNCLPSKFCYWLFSPTPLYLYVPIVPILGSIFYIDYNNRLGLPTYMDVRKLKSYNNPGLYIGLGFSMVYLTLSTFKHIKN